MSNTVPKLADAAELQKQMLELAAKMGQLCTTPPPSAPPKSRQLGDRERIERMKTELHNKYKFKHQ